MLKSFTIALSLLLASTSFVAAKELPVPKTIKGERVHYALWTKKTSSGSVRRRLVSVRVKKSIKVPSEFSRL